MRRWSGDRERKISSLGDAFRVEQARCSNEDDRVPVMENIAKLLQDMGDLRPGGTLQEATEIFNSLVRDSVLRELRASVGRFRFPYSHALIVSMSLLGQCFDAVGSEIAAGTPAAQGVARCWFWFAWYTAGVPVVVAIVSLVVRRLLHLRGVLNAFFLLSVSIFVFASYCDLETVFAISVRGVFQCWLTRPQHCRHDLDCRGRLLDFATLQEGHCAQTSHQQRGISRRSSQTSLAHSSGKCTRQHCHWANNVRRFVVSIGRCGGDFVPERRASSSARSQQSSGEDHVSLRHSRTIPGSFGCVLALRFTVSMLSETEQKDGSHVDTDVFSRWKAHQKTERSRRK